jgi:hypothetical protein
VTVAFGAFIIVSVTWVGILATLSLDRLGIRRVPPGSRLQGYGILLVTSGILVGSFAEVQGWSLSLQRDVKAIMVAPVLAGLALLIISLVRVPKAPKKQRRNRP